MESFAKSQKKDPKEAMRDRFGAIILCGGKGTRMSLLTEDKIPKPLYSVNGKELISYSLDLLDESGINRILFAVKHLSEQIESWINSSNLNCDAVVMKIQGRSTAAAISEGLALIDRDQVVILSGDEIIMNFKLASMMEQHERTGSLLTILATDPRNAVGDGVLLELDGNRIKGISEKRSEIGRSGQHGLLYHAGVIMIKQEALQYIALGEQDPKGGVIDMPIMRGGLSAGILNAYVDKNLTFFNINSPKEVNVAESKLSYMKRFVR